MYILPEKFKWSLVAAQASAGIFVSIYDAICQGIWYAVSDRKGFSDSEDNRRYLTVMEAFSNGISFALYITGFTLSILAVNRLSESKVTLWAMKRHAEEEKQYTVIKKDDNAD